MTVLGGRELSERFRRIGARAKEEIAKSVQEGAELVLADQKRLVRVETGALKNALLITYTNDGLTARIGPPTDGISYDRLSGDFFYARFLEFGTKGYAVGERRISTRGGAKRPHKRAVPPKPAYPFVGPSADLNKNEITTKIRAAVRRAIDNA